MCVYNEMVLVLLLLLLCLDCFYMMKCTYSHIIFLNGEGISKGLFQSIVGFSNVLRPGMAAL